MNDVGSREYFLSDIPLEEAQEIFMTRVSCLNGGGKGSSAKIEILCSVDRVLSENVFAEFSSPTVNTAAMDGISIDSRTSVGANETNPITLD